jgi:acylphosphatase
MRIARHYLVDGRVQGVGFRYFVQDRAAAEGLHGWVRNRPDGSVEILIEGEQDSVERFERLVRHGPPRAEVRHLEVNDAAPADRQGGCVIR